MAFQPEPPALVIWMIGFDCSHAWDANPVFDILSAKSGIGMGLTSLNKDKGVTWKDLAFVKGQCEVLAYQLWEMGPSRLREVAEITWDSPDKEEEKRLENLAKRRTTTPKEK